MTSIQNVYTVRNDYYGTYEPLYLCPDDGLMVYRVMPLLQNQFGPQALQHCVCYRIGTFDTSTATLTSCAPVTVPWTAASPEAPAVDTATGPAASAKFAADTADLTSK